MITVFKCLFIFGTIVCALSFFLKWLENTWSDKLLCKYKLNSITITHFFASFSIMCILVSLEMNIDSANQLSKQNKLLENQYFVSNSLSIAKIGDRCMWTAPGAGDYDSYLLLKQMEADPTNIKMINSIRNQIKRVEKKYKPVDMLNVYANNLQAIWKEGADPKKGDVWADIETVTLDNILNHMKNRYL